jgi:hypothetical protein
MKKQNKKVSQSYRIDISGIINIVNDEPITRKSNPHKIHRIMKYTQQQEDLAFELAEALNDTKSMKFYLDAVVRYSESYLREQLATALAKKQSEITSSRAAFFNWLLHNEQAAKNYSRD